MTKILHGWMKVLRRKLWPKSMNVNLLMLIKRTMMLTWNSRLYQQNCQRAVLNGQCSSWSSVLAGVPQGSILGPLLFLIYINDLPENLQSTVKLFEDDTSLFSTVYELNISASQLESGLKKISHWTHKWKMNFNPDLSKQAQEVIFSRKPVKVSHPSITFNTAPVARTPCQKHLDLYLDEKLNFHDHINAKILKANKGIEIIKRLLNALFPESPFSESPFELFINLSKDHILTTVTSSMTSLIMKVFVPKLNIYSTMLPLL